MADWAQPHFEQIDFKDMPSLPTMPFLAAAFEIYAIPPSEDDTKI